MQPYADWRAVYEPLYGEAADASLYETHRMLGASPSAADYAAAVGPGVRRLLGEYYTPDWLVEQTLARAEYGGERMLDPSCGAGAFLAACGEKASGWDIHPIAVRMARERCPLARVEERDAFANSIDAQSFDFMAGNPPWVNWRRLGPGYRARVEPLWRHYGLFAEKGIRSRLGGAMNDLSALMTFVCADRWLAPDGRLAFLLPLNLFQSAGGGAGFRRFALPGGHFLRVVRIEEVGEPRPFEGATTRTAIAVFEKSRVETVFPVAYVRDGKQCEARPIGQEKWSPWMVTESGESFDDLRGASPYRARVGAHTGGAAGVYWVDVIEDDGSTLLIRNRAGAGRNAYTEMTARVERKFVRPLVRGRDLQDGAAQPSGWVIIPHDPSTGKPVTESTMQVDYPLTYAWFERFREPMRQRPHYRQHFEKGGLPYWSMYNVGPYTFAEHRVAWREQSSKFQCALLPPGVIADAKLATVAVSSAGEARHLAAFLSQDRVGRFIESYVLKTQISTHVMKYVRVPEFRLRQTCELLADQRTSGQTI